jgi:hypothetical protein
MPIFDNLVVLLKISHMNTTTGGMTGILLQILTKGHPHCLLPLHLPMVDCYFLHPHFSHFHSVKQTLNEGEKD